MSVEAVKVIVRTRPLNDRENQLKCNNVLEFVSAKGQCTIRNPSESGVANANSPPKTFFFDGSYDCQSTTSQIYADIAYPLVEGVTEGYNGTIFAYGQTGCGKSYTMQGVAQPETQRGIIPRAFDHIFETISVAEKTKFLVHASFLEIYNENIRDLLSKDSQNTRLELKEHPERGVYIPGLSMHKVTNVKECQVIMEAGWRNRATGATLMNADSSRSHSIFTIQMEMAETSAQAPGGEDAEDEHIRVGKLNLVDLAGSERQSKTGATGDRLKEATKINLSLSALGNVISALVDAKSKHIPYRDSKLTRILQDSLGGNTKTLMIACLSPADNNYEETLSTLRYANRAKNIQNKPTINEDPKDALLREKQEEINRLKQMLMSNGYLSQSPSMSQNQLKHEHEDRERKRMQQIQQEKQQLQQEYEIKLAEKEGQYAAEAADRAKLQREIDHLRTLYDANLAKLEQNGGEFGGSGENSRVSSSSSNQHRQQNRTTASFVGDIGNAGDDGAAAGAANELDDSVLIVGQEGSLRRDQMLVSAGKSGDTTGSRKTSATAQQQHASINEVGGGGTDMDAASSMMLAGNSKRTAVHMGSSKAKAKESMSKDELINRIKLLESGMVGGEQVANAAQIKEKRSRQMRHAEERKRRLATVNDKLEEDDGIMLEIYDNIQEEMKAKTRLLSKNRLRLEETQMELDDFREEARTQKEDLLDTLRKSDRSMQLLETLLSRIQPLIRKDCNYSNLDKIRSEARWDENSQQWLLPAIQMERTQLPMNGGGGGTTGSSSAGGLFSNRRELLDSYGTSGGGGGGGAGGGASYIQHFSAPQAAENVSRRLSSAALQHHLQHNSGNSAMNGGSGGGGGVGGAASAFAEEEEMMSAADQRAAMVHGFHIMRTEQDVMSSAAAATAAAGYGAGAGGPPPNLLRSNNMVPIDEGGTAFLGGVGRRPVRLEALPLASDRFDSHPQQRNSKSGKRRSQHNQYGGDAGGGSGGGAPGYYRNEYEY